MLQLIYKKGTLLYYLIMDKKAAKEISKHPFDKSIKLKPNEKQKKEKISIKEAKPFLGYFFVNKPLCFFLVLTLVINTFLGLYAAVATGNLLASFTENFTKQNSLKWVIITCSVVAAANITNLINNILIQRFNGIVYLCMYHDIVVRMNLLSQSCYDNQGSNFYLTRLGMDLNHIQSNIIDILYCFVRVLGNLGFLAYTFILNKWICLFLMAMVVINLVYNSLRTRLLVRQRRVIGDTRDQIGGIKIENIRGMKDIRGLNTTDTVVREVNMRQRTIESMDYKASLNNRCVIFGGQMIRVLMDFCYFLMCIYLIANDQLALAGFMIAYNYKGNIVGLANQLISIKEDASNLALAAHRMNELYDEKSYPIEVFGDTKLEDCKGEIEFKNVSFEYVEDKPVLKDVSFKIQPQTIVSFVGMSGEGKSTIVSLMNKLYDLKEGCGQICLDGHDITTLTRDSIRDNICVVSQAPYVFDMTVAENLKLSKPDATEEEMQEALKKAEFYDFVMELKDKLNSRLGENGIKLSGGQKQRLAIARALLKDAKVIVFDEATSSLDNDNQAKIKKVMKNLSKDHTIVMVAHRLSTVVDSDNIIFIRDGGVFAQGTHDYLMDTCPQYRELYSAEDINV